MSADDVAARLNGGGSPAKFMHYREQSTGASRRRGVQHRSRELHRRSLSGTASLGHGVRRLLPAVRRAGRCAAAPSAPEEDRPDGDKVVVLSHGVWIRRFDSDPDVIGKTISLSGNPHTVIGVLDPSVRLPGAGAGSRGLDWPFQFDPNTKTRATISGGRPARARRLARAGAGAAVALVDGVPAKFPNALGQDDGLRGGPMRDALVTQRPLVAVGARRRGQLRAAHRLRERRQPAARARDRAAARDCGARRASAPVAAVSCVSC